MKTIRHIYPGGNTRYGFYSFYDYILPLAGQDEYKMILKGGPGTGKSSLMKKVGEHFNVHELEYHWCSSDNQALDAVVIDARICILDGTAPHTVDPRYPGAYDDIIPLGNYWDGDRLQAQRHSIQLLTDEVSQFFQLAYYRLREAYTAYQEWEYYYQHHIDKARVKKNIMALGSEFMATRSVSSPAPTRHLFAAAITPQGIVTRVESLLPEKIQLFAVKGSPGSGKSELFHFISRQCAISGIGLEHYHNPFNPDEIDLLIAPEREIALLDISGIFVDYEAHLSKHQYLRLLDFDQLLNPTSIDPWAKRIHQTQNRLIDAIQDASQLIRYAKERHDELEAIYIAAMHFDELDQLQEQIIKQIIARI